jgi:PPOX class probable F420-dependent enzyme
MSERPRSHVDAETAAAVTNTAMTAEEISAFLEEPRYVAVATLRKDGSPLVVPMGFLWDGTHLYVNAAADRPINKRLARDPRVSCTIFNTSFPTAYVLIEGRAEPVDDPDLERARELMTRYIDPSKDTLAAKDLDIEEFHRNWLTSGGRKTWRVIAHRMIGYDSAKKGDAAALAKYAAYSVSELESIRAAQAGS